jgi:homoserine kinase
MKKYIHVEIPAAIANFGPGFDTFGMCLNEPRDNVEIWLDAKGGFDVFVDPEEYGIPTDVQKNTGSYAAFKMAEYFKEKIIFEMRITKGIPPEKGLGSSGASAAGGAYGMMRLMGRALREGDLVKIAAEGENIVAGVPHPECVAAQLFGGFTIVRSTGKGYDVVKINPPEDLFIIVVTPKISIASCDARQAVPTTVELENIADNIGNAAALVQAMLAGDIEKVGDCLRDQIAVPHRRCKIPGFNEAEKAALKAGGYGFNISGGGPSVFTLADGRSKPNSILKAIIKGFKKDGVAAEGFVTVPGKGVRIVEMD